MRKKVITRRINQGNQMKTIKLVDLKEEKILNSKHKRDDPEVTAKRLDKRRNEYKI